MGRGRRREISRRIDRSARFRPRDLEANRERSLEVLALAGGVADAIDLLARDARGERCVQQARARRFTAANTATKAPPRRFGATAQRRFGVIAASSMVLRRDRVWPAVCILDAHDHHCSRRTSNRCFQRAARRNGRPVSEGPADPDHHCDAERIPER